MTVIAPTPEQVEQAKTQYAHSLEILLAAQRAADHDLKGTLVGKYFRHRAELSSDPGQKWPVYIAAVGMDDRGHLVGWHHQRAPTNQIEVAAEDDMQAGFLVEQCEEISRDEFTAAFNELLTRLARFALGTV